MIDFELAPFAVNENNSRGRQHKESELDNKYRSIFGRDRDRIINSSSFRRLQYKTQVFINHAGDHYRTRLTHSLEVAQISRWISSALKVNKDLSEIISLAHDIGHPPFGHSGEKILHEKMLEFGGFSHNAHTIKILTEFENKFIEFPGLNLSWEIIEGTAKHNGPIKDLTKTHSYIVEYNKKFDLELDKFPSIESQISSVSDDVAYTGHDIEDALKANLFRIKDLFDLPLIGRIYQNLLKKYPDVAEESIINEAKREMTREMIMDIISKTQDNIKLYNIKSEDDIRNNNFVIAEFSEDFYKANITIKKFFQENIYTHPKINRVRVKSKKIISKLFDFYMENPNSLMDNRHIDTGKITDQGKLAVIISDYIAAMTDRYIIKEFKELYHF
jgi:dGTPase